MSPRGWTVWIDHSRRSPQEKLAGEEELLRAVGQEGRGAVIRLWTSAPSLVLGRLEARRLQQRGRLPARFGRAPVLVRPSGGTLVPHGPRELNVTLCYPAPVLPVPAEPGYRLLVHLLQRAIMKGFGLEAAEGAVPGSFCDGRFNLVVGGRKVAGTAQAQRRGAVLVHATVMVAGPGADRLEQVAAFYREVGEAGVWNPGSVASLSELLARPVVPADLVASILDALAGEPPAPGQVPAALMANGDRTESERRGRGRGFHG